MICSQHLSKRRGGQFYFQGNNAANHDTFYTNRSYPCYLSVGNRLQQPYACMLSALVDRKICTLKASSFLVNETPYIDLSSLSWFEGLSLKC